MSSPGSALALRSGSRRRSRVNSRSSRLSRLRRTADCPCFGTTKPTREGPSRLTATRASINVPRSRRPSRATARSSLPRVRRWRRGKRRRSRDEESSGAGVLRRKLDGEALAPLLASATQDFSSPLRRHPRAEPVRADASLVAGTVRRLTHGYYSTMQS